MMDLPQYPTTIIYISTSDIPKNFKPIKFFFFFFAKNPNKREKKSSDTLKSGFHTFFLFSSFVGNSFLGFWHFSLGITSQNEAPFPYPSPQTTVSCLFKWVNQSLCSSSGQVATPTWRAHLWLGPWSMRKGMITAHWRAIAHPHTSPLTAPRFPPQLWMGVISDSLLSAEAAPMLSSVCFVVSGTDDRSFLLYSVPFRLQSNIQFL